MLDRQFLTILVTSFLASTMYGLAAPFLPALLEERGVASTWTGLIFGIYAFSMVVFSLITGKIVDRVGHGKIMAIGTFVMALSIVSFAAAIYIDENLLIIAFIVALRVLQGGASGLITTTSFSFMTQAYPDDIEQVVAYVEIVVGIGCTAGPVIGSLIYQFVGFSWTFIIFGALMTPSCLFVCCIGKPSDVRKKRERVEAESGTKAAGRDSASSAPDNSVTNLLYIGHDDDESQTKLSVLGKDVTYCQLLCTPRVLFAGLAACVSNFVYSTFEPTLSLRLTEFGMSQTYQGLVIGIIPIFYMLGSILNHWIFPKWIETRVILMTGALILAFSVPLAGPFFEEKNTAAMLAGLVVSGSMLGPMVIPVMAEMMRATKLAFPESNPEQANSLLSAILNCNFGAGQALGPLIGAAVYQASGFRVMCDLVGVVCLVFFLGYLFIATGCQAYSLTCQNFSKRHDRQPSQIEQLQEEALDIKYSAAMRASVISSKKQRLMSTLSHVESTKGAADQQLYSSVTQAIPADAPTTETNHQMC